MIVPEKVQETSKKLDRPEKADNPVIFAFIDFLKAAGYVVNLKPVNGVQMPVIVKVAA